MNVGTVPGLPYPPASLAGGGQVRRRLSALGWGGALVVVRGRESRPHGEGGQRDRSEVLECQEVAGEYRRFVAAPDEAEARVLRIQTKLHQWAADDPDRRFDDLYNLVCDPAVLVTAWERVRGNRGARSAGVDGETAFYVTAVRGDEGFLAELRARSEGSAVPAAARAGDG